MDQDQAFGKREGFINKKSLSPIQPSCDLKLWKQNAPKYKYC